MIQLGSNVKDHVQPGDIIGIPWIHQTCLHCEFCLSGREEFCLKLVRSGVSVDGCFAQYALMNGHFAVKLPSGMDPYASAPIYCAGVTMYKALKNSKVRPGEWVSIVGIGGLGKTRDCVIFTIPRSLSGSLGIRYARAMGMRVIAVVAPGDQVKSADLIRVSTVASRMPCNYRRTWAPTKVSHPSVSQGRINGGF